MFSSKYVCDAVENNSDIIAIVTQQHSVFGPFQQKDDNTIKIKRICLFVC